ncbi:MAG: hypothetical protein J2P21_01865 [Chloracidobacterium sp.]|nr:hypothetical protein [Chloracidobacterium sp.]
MINHRYWIYRSHIVLTCRIAVVARPSQAAPSGHVRFVANPGFERAGAGLDLLALLPRPFDLALIAIKDRQGPQPRLEIGVEAQHGIRSQPSGDDAKVDGAQIVAFGKQAKVLLNPFLNGLTKSYSLRLLRLRGNRTRNVCEKKSENKACR